MIPKIIHYCWLSNDPVPEELKKYMSSWKEKIPDYEFIKWDFSRFDKNSSQWVAEAFDNKKYAFAADYIRLYAVYNHGGIYLDMDIEVVKKFDDMLDKKYMLAYENPEKNGIEAGCFGAEKNDPFIRDCLRYYDGRSFIKSDGTFDTRPLPQIMNEVMITKKYDYKIYDHRFFTAKSFQTGVIKVYKETYSIHHFAGSWLDDEEKLKNKLRTKLCKFIPVKLAGRIAKFFAICKIRGIVPAFKETMKFLTKKKKL